MVRSSVFVAAMLFFGVLLVSLWGNAFAQEKAKEKPATAKVKWEYKVIPMPNRIVAATEKALNELGRDGWELVAITPADKGFIGQAFFKRPLAEPAKKEEALPK